MKEIVLYKEKLTKVDDGIYDFLIQWKWGFDGRYAYRRQKTEKVNGKQKYKKIYMQKVINNTPDGMDTDHINGDKLDNRKENLRTATRGQNNANMPKMPKKCSSIYKGVHWHEHTKKWKAEIKVNGVKKYLGVFIKEEDAAKAYNEAAQKAFGKFSKQNNL